MILKKLLFCVVFLIYVGSLFAQHDQNPKKLYLNYQTDSKGLIKYGSGVPNYLPATRYDCYSYFDTISNVMYEFHLDGSGWNVSAPGDNMGNMHTNSGYITAAGNNSKSIRVGESDILIQSNGSNQSTASIQVQDNDIRLRKDDGSGGNGTTELQINNNGVLVSSTQNDTDFEVDVDEVKLTGNSIYIDDPTAGTAPYASPLLKTSIDGKVYFPNYSSPASAPATDSLSWTMNGDGSGQYLNTKNDYDNSATGLNATDFQGAINEMIGLIPGGVSGGNIVYVSKATGNNSTARQGNYLFPFKEPWSARDSAVAWSVDYVYILDGEFTYDWSYDAGHDFFANSDIERLSLCRDLTYIANSGVSFSSYSTSNALFYDEWGYDCKFLGRADFFINNHSLVRLFNGNAKLHIEGSVLYMNVDNKYLSATKNQGFGTFSEFSLSFEEIKTTGNTVFFSIWHDWGQPDTINNIQLSFNFKNLNLAYISEILSLEPAYIQNCNFTINVENLIAGGVPFGKSQRLIKTYSSLVNSKIILNINNYIEGEGQGSSSFLHFVNHSQAKNCVNSEININVKNADTYSELISTSSYPRVDDLAVQFRGNIRKRGVTAFFTGINSGDNNNVKYKIAGDVKSDVEVFTIEANYINLNCRGLFSSVYSTPVINYTPLSASVGTIELTNSYLKNTGGALITAPSAQFNINAGGTYLSNSTSLTNVNVTQLTKLQ